MPRLARSIAAHRRTAGRSQNRAVQQASDSSERAFVASCSGLTDCNRSCHASGRSRCGSSQHKLRKRSSVIAPTTFTVVRKASASPSPGHTAGPTDFFGRPIRDAPAADGKRSTERTAAVVAGNRRQSVDNDVDMAMHGMTVAKLRARPNCARTREQLYLSNRMRKLSNGTAMKTEVDPDGDRIYTRTVQRGQRGGWLSRMDKPKRGWMETLLGGK